MFVVSLSTINCSLPDAGGGATEVEHILGFMLNKAREANIANPTLLLAYTHIKAFEQRRAAGRLP